MRGKSTSSIFRKVLILLIFAATALVFSDEISFFNTNIKDVLNTISLDYGKVILYEPNITGAVTLNLSSEHIDFERLLTLILLPYNYYWTKIEDIYFVGIANPNSPSFVNVSRMYEIPLRYTSSDKIYDMIPKVFQDYIIKQYTADNLLVYAPIPIASKIANFVSKIDKPLEKRSIEIKIVDTSESYLKSLLNDVLVLSGSTIVPFLPNQIQVSLPSMSLNVIYANSKDEEGQFQVIYEGILNASNNVPLKVSTQKVMTVNKYSDGKLISTQTTSEINVQITPKFLYTSCLIDVDVQISGLPTTNEANFESRGSSLKTTTNIEYGKYYVLASVSYDRLVQKEGGVTVLKDIPIIGNFFKRYYYETEKRYIIFILSVGDKQ
ncbi:MAG: hypothetical protein ACPL3B_05405 [Fervidobacterium sp.]